MRKIRLHDTGSGGVVDLEPREPGKVGIYACGPTVYNRIHIGNARPFVVFSLLTRFLEHEGYDVTFVANVTDVNDKIYDAARPLGVPSADLAREMTAHYVQDTEGLGLGRPDAEPLASETIDGIVGLIQALLDADNAYAVDGDVYFRVRADPSYGKLSHRRVDDMDQGEGVEGADRKQDPLDFALWKAQKPGEDTAWDAPWGRRRRWTGSSGSAARPSGQRSPRSGGSARRRCGPSGSGPEPWRRAAAGPVSRPSPAASSAATTPSSLRTCALLRNPGY